MSPNSNGGAGQGPAAQTTDPASQPHDQEQGSPLALELARLLADYPPVVLMAALVRLAGAHRVATVHAADQILATSTRPTRWHAGPYHRRVPLPAHAETARHRYPPTGDPELWVRYGPAGPPPPALAPPAPDSPRREVA